MRQSAVEAASRQPTLATPREATRISAIYALVASLWIYFSGLLLHALVHDDAWQAWLENVKGWAFVAVTFVMLRWTLVRNFQAIATSTRQLADSEARLRLISDHLPNTFVYQLHRDVQGTARFTYVSAGVERVHAVSVKEIMRDPGALRGLTAPESVPDVMRVEQQSEATLTDFNLEIWVINPDGQRRRMQLHSHPRRLPDGSVVWDGVSTDVTESRRAEASMRESERRLRLFVEHCPGGLAMFDREMRYLVASRRYKLDCQLDPNDPLTGRSHYDLFPHIPESWREHHRQALQGISAKSDKDLFLQADGSQDWLRWEVHPWFEEDGQIGGIMIFSEVITERVVAELAVVEAEARYRSLFENATEGIFVSDQEGRLVRANPAMAAILGCETADELLRTYGKIESLGWKPEDGTRSFRGLEAQLLRRDGQPIWVSLNGHTFRQADGQIVLEGSIQDVTERRQQQLEIIRLNRLYTTLGRVNQSIVRCSDRAQLLGEVCEAICDTDDGLGVWIAEYEAPQVARQVASRGLGQVEPSLLEHCQVVPNVGVQAEALFQLNGLRNCPEDCPCNCHCFHSAVALPLHVGQEAWGILCILSREQDSFHDSEVQLLKEIAEDLSFALQRQHELELKSRAEESVRTYRARLDAALLGMTDAVALSDPDGNILEFNDAFATFHRFHNRVECSAHLQDLPGLVRYETLDGQAVSPEQLPLARALGGETRALQEWRLARTDTGERWVASYSYAPIRGRQGEILGAVAVGRDVTAQKEAELVLQETRERFQFALESSHLGAWNLDTTTGLAERNLIHSRIFGESPDSLWTYQHFLDCVVPDDRERVRRANLQARETGRDFSLECRIRRLDGEERWLYVAGGPATHEPNRLSGIVQDITDRKRDEEVLNELNRTLELRVTERTAALQASLEEMDTFAYAVSHDLRAPLRAVAGFSQALEEDCAAGLDSTAHEYIRHIREGAHHMADLIDGLLRLSRTTQGELNLEEVDLSEVATTILARLCKAEPARPVEWQVEPGLLAHGDRRLLEVVLENLIGNAWKYSSKAPSARLRFYREGSDFCLSDNGTGFDMRYAAKLFQPFQRMHREDEFPGIGIGLATVQRILRRHGGRVSATSAPGCGATFRFTLPDPVAEDAPPVRS